MKLDGLRCDVTHIFKKKIKWHDQHIFGHEFNPSDKVFFLHDSRLYYYPKNYIQDGRDRSM